MKNLIKNICLSTGLFLACLNCLADTETNLQVVDQYLGNPAWETSFKDGDLGIFQNRSCISTQICDQFEYPLLVKREGPEVVNVISQAGSAYESKERIEKSVWLETHGNRLRTQLKLISGYGFQVELGEPQKSECKYQKDGKIVTDECLEIIASLRNQAGTKGSIKFQVNKNLGGLGQILLRSQKMMGLDEIRFVRYGNQK